MADFTQPVSKYYQIYDELLEEIRSGKFKEYDRFYSDTELVEKFEVSRGTWYGNREKELLLQT